ncbi:NIF domain-containing protein [Trichophyton tonsurans CBS 112818]|uniref:NIF domain-containing protein n=2 Tax=Trichophyton TaxID=5550 RepID=F2PXY6_TRIEC|nr:NIF domain-containing protein [Trichophyton tonsurans CBS 112818]EGE06754.1 NIF domain-containing protein [Trichophyton equinum CBS 127.97]
MNSLNILSSRVIGQASASSSSRARSHSQGHVLNPRGGLAASSRSYSDGNLNVHQHSMQTDGTPGDDEDELEARGEVLSLLTVEDADQKQALAHDSAASTTAGMVMLPITQRFFGALLETLKTILSIFASPAVYLGRRFYSRDGQFSLAEPLRSRRQDNSTTSSTTTAAGNTRRSRRDGADSGSRPDRGQKRPSRGSPRLRDSLSSESLYSNTSESETDRALGEPGNESKQNREQRHSKARASRRSDGSSNTSSAIGNGNMDPVADSLKSPVSQAARRLTRYPHAPTPPRPLVPRRQPSYIFGAPPPRTPQKTLILDLDETLIHSLSKGGRMSSGHMVEVKLSMPMASAATPGAAPTILGPQHPILYYVHKRPHCDAFLRKVCQWYKLVIFTASVQEYADPVIDWLEQERKYFHSRYYRQHCTIRNGAYIKDLSSVEPDLNNAIPIEGWINDPTDNDLLHLIPILEAMQHVTDVRALLALRRGEVGS